MGRDKATLEFEGQPLWQRQLGVLHAVGPQAFFVSARTAPPWLPDDVELLLDDPPSRGPLSGLAKALAVMRTTHLLALAVDMPFMTGAVLSGLWGQAREGQGVIPVIRGRAEPLAAIYPAELAPDFAAALNGNDFSLQSIVRTLAGKERLRLVPVRAEDEQLYRSVNEPHDLATG